MEARGGASAGRVRRGWAAVLVACCVLAVLPAAASAVTLTLTAAADPVESITTQFGATGSLDAGSQEITLRVKPSGGTGCAANPDADNGTLAVYDDSAGPGPYTETRNWTFDSAGSYLVCGWVVDTGRAGDPVVASSSETIAVRIPHLALSIGAPASVLRGRAFQVTMTAQTEAQREVDVALLPDAGRGCPANWGAAQDTAGWSGVFEDSVTGGPTTDARNEQLDATGRYLLCGYVDYDGQVTPEATASAAVDVVPPCVVPHLGPHATLRSAKARIVAAHCTVGVVRYVRSSRRRGTVLALSPRPGTGHATHAPVRITVSAGPRRQRRHR